MLLQPPHLPVQMGWPRQSQTCLHSEINMKHLLWLKNWAVCIYFYKKGLISFSFCDRKQLEVRFLWPIVVSFCKPSLPLKKAVIQISKSKSKCTLYHFLYFLLIDTGLTILSTCWEKLWLMYMASIDRLRGEFILVPSSCGVSVAVSLTVNWSVTNKK